ncbi:MAG: hypothetical protein R3B46_02355 [Phycisphaerales bacterium]
MNPRPIALLLALIPASLAPAQAAETDAEPSLSLRTAPDWTVKIEPMLWAPALAGDLIVSDDSFNTEWVNADEVNLAPAGRVTINADEWRFLFEGFAVSADNDDKVRNTFTADGVTFTRGTDADLNLDLSVFKLAAGKEIWRKPFSEDVALALDVYAGARLIDIDLNLENAAGASIGGDGIWIEPLAGFNVAFELPRGFDLRFALDGGVALGEDIGFDYQVVAAFGWRFADNVGIEIGFRHISFDVNDNDFAFDGWAAGLFGSIVIYF